jgi:4'-phosphopantetheinyl transferase
MDFNVSHQAGIVSLIAVVGVGGNDEIEVGTDVVCWNERLTQDYAAIERDGFFDWVDMHRDVFADSELSYMKLAPVDVDFAPQGVFPGGYGKDKVSRCQRRNETLILAIWVGGEDGTIPVSSNEIIDKKLRRFYACWCLREAYVKMTGEALLAPWLKELEIRDVKAPRPSKAIKDGELLRDGEARRDFKIIFKGRPVTNVLLELVALGQDYMIGGAIRPADRVEELHLTLGKWEHLGLEDVLAFAESNP